MENKIAQQLRLKKELKRFFISLFIVIVLVVAFCTVQSYAATNVPGFTVDFNTTEGGDDIMGALDVMIMFSLIALLPSIVLMMTSFTRIIIIFSFMRNALGTQQSPPNVVLTGLAIFLTLFIMQPTLTEIKEQAYDPYKEGTLTQQQAIDVGTVSLKRFMLQQTDVEALNLYINISKTEIQSVDGSETKEALLKLPLTVIVPAFVTSELETAFLIGFFLYLPFLIIDIVVSSVLMSMGMVMLPPAMISLPFKILMFVMVNGWSLLTSTIVRGFMG